jgi:hypothetical protein
MRFAIQEKSEITNRTRNTLNRISAIPAAVPAILEKPSSAVITAMIGIEDRPG